MTSASIEKQIETLTAKLDRRLCVNGFNYGEKKYAELYSKRENCVAALKLLVKAEEILSWNK